MPAGSHRAMFDRDRRRRRVTGEAGPRAIAPSWPRLAAGRRPTSHRSARSTGTTRPGRQASNASRRRRCRPATCNGLPSNSTCIDPSKNDTRRPSAVQSWPVESTAACRSSAMFSAQQCPVADRLQCPSCDDTCGQATTAERRPLIPLHPGYYGPAAKAISRYSGCGRRFIDLGRALGRTEIGWHSSEVNPWSVAPLRVRSTGRCP